MHQYVYKPEDLGLTAFSPGELRLAGIEKTENPAEADIFVLPGGLHSFFPADLDRLPYINGRWERLVALHVSDDDAGRIHYERGSLFLRCNTRPHVLATDPNTISWAWPVDDFAECIPIPPNGFLYDVSFHGWVKSHPSREIATSACLANHKLRCDFARYADFCGYIYDTPEGLRRRAEFRRSMRESRLALCPESIDGVFPYRFFEAMSAGRMPVLVSSDYVLPWEKQIPYHEFCLFVPRSDAERTGEIVLDFVRTHTDDEITYRGGLGRRHWERYLDSRKWETLATEAVKMKLESLGISCQ